MGTASIERKQYTRLSEIPQMEIPRGANVPLEFFYHYLPLNSTVAEFGVGTGTKAALLAQGNEFKVIGFDINPQAVAAAKDRGVSSFVMDVSNADSFFAEKGSLRRNQFDAIIMEGLLCNLMGEQLTRALHVAHQALVPQGRIFVADVLAADQPNVFVRQYLAKAYHRWVRSWQRRYEENRKLGLPEKHFVVYKPGEQKIFEWRPEGPLENIVRHPNFERFARHLNEQDLRDTLFDVGFSIDHFAYTFWGSRTELTLSGFILVAQKR